MATTKGNAARGDLAYLAAGAFLAVLGAATGVSWADGVEESPPIARTAPSGRLAPTAPPPAATTPPAPSPPAATATDAAQAPAAAPAGSPQAAGVAATTALPPAVTPVTAGPAGRSGLIAVPASDLALTVPTSFLFYPPDAARAHLGRVGAPTPTGDIVGMLAPADLTPGQDDFWGAVLTYQQIGRVDAATASGLADAGFDQTVRQARASAQRSFQRFETPPSFVASQNALNWVEQTAQPQPTAFAYRAEGRILGRRGVAGVTAPARADQLAQVKALSPTLAGMIGFSQGNAYADYNAQIDTASVYTVPGLVTNLPATGVAQAASAGGPEARPDAGKDGATTNYLPWLVGGAAAVGLLAWLALGTRRRLEDEDPNLRPRDE